MSMADEDRQGGGVTGSKKLRRELYESRNEEEGSGTGAGVTGAKKPRTEPFSEIKCKHGRPIFGSCRECFEERREQRSRECDSWDQGEHCGKCGEPLPAAAPVYVHSRRGQVALCAGCTWSRDHRHYYYLEGPCEHCGRPVVRECASHRSAPARLFCCRAHQQTFYNRLHSGRRKQRNARYREKVCEECGEPFTAARVDAKHCGAACKQRAYRDRMKAHERR